MRLRESLTLLILVTSAGCARRLVSSSLPFEQHTLRVHLTLNREGSATLATYQPLVGRIGLKPILEAEGMWPPGGRETTVELLVNYGRFYVFAEGFRAVWEITPRPGTPGASYRPAVILADRGLPPPRGVRLSRYGSSGTSCLRVDREVGPVLYVTAQGEVHDRCP